MIIGFLLNPVTVALAVLFGATWYAFGLWPMVGVVLIAALLMGVRQ